MSDGFKVDQDCLDLELSPEKVFIAQKYMTEKAKMADKLVITSTDIALSMQTNGKPTKSEISMVSNAVLDGVNYITLHCDAQNGETNIQALKLLNNCCLEAEKMLEFRVDHRREGQVAQMTEETHSELQEQQKA